MSTASSTGTSSRSVRLSSPLAPKEHKPYRGVVRVAPFHRRLRITDPAALSAHYVLLQSMVPGQNSIQPCSRLATYRSAIRKGAHSWETARQEPGGQDW